MIGFKKKLRNQHFTVEGLNQIIVSVFFIKINTKTVEIT